MRFSTLSLILFTVTASASTLSAHLTRRQEAEDVLMELFARGMLYSTIDPRDAEADPGIGSFFKKLGGGLKSIIGLRRRNAQLAHLAAGGDPELLARSFDWSDEESDNLGISVRDFDEDLYAREYYDEDLF